MSTMQIVFQRAQLTEAAYANFINPNTGAIFNTNAGIRDALIASGFSSDPNNTTQSTQAADFITKYRVIDQYTAPPLIFGVGSTGFSATLFQDLETGRYTFAIRGTETGLADLIADLINADLQGIVVNGVAMNQLVEMYNYWQSINASPNTVYQAAKLERMTAETVQLNALRLLGPAGTVAYQDYVAQLKASNLIIETSLTGPVFVRRVITGDSNVPRNPGRTGATH